jgi:hypothetical protein
MFSAAGCWLLVSEWIVSLEVKAPRFGLLEF